MQKKAVIKLDVPDWQIGEQVSLFFPDSMHTFAKCEEDIKSSETSCEAENTQEAKADKGKARLTLVPRKILYDIARIREYGNRKYGNPDNWKTVEPWRYRDAMMRHMCAYLDDPQSVDEESGLPHLWHLACNIAFLCEMESEGEHQ